jgi:hypothetical protein
VTGGWIKLHRKLADDPAWTSEPFTRAQAWVDLLMIANFEPSHYYLRGNKIEVGRGQLAWAEEKLASRWQWSRTKVRSFINELKKEQQIIQQKSKLISILTIVKYEDYQKKEQQTGQQKDDKKTTEKHIKEGKEGQEDKRSKKPFVASDDAMRLSSLLFDEIVTLNPDGRLALCENGDRKIKVDRWAKDIDYLLRLDLQPAGTIEDVIKFATRDSFWAANILSGKKLREKWEQLTAKINKDKNKREEYL